MPVNTKAKQVEYNKLDDAPADVAFNAPTFLRHDSSSTAAQLVEDEEMPSNLMNSRSNVPGMTPQELLTAHRRSLADLSGNPDVDMHSITLSRHQVDGVGMYSAAEGDVGEEEFRDALESFKFGDIDDDTQDNNAITPVK